MSTTTPSFSSGTNATHVRRGHDPQRPRVSASVANVRSRASGLSTRSRRSVGQGVPARAEAAGETEGAVALWIGPGTEGHFSNLKISR